MPERSGWRYYAALVASGVSVAGWLATLASGAAAFYFAVAGGPVSEYSTYTVAAVVVAIAFARVEKRLYRLER